MNQGTRILLAALAVASTGLAAPHTGWAQTPAKTSLTLVSPIEPPHLDPTGAAAAAIREVTWQNLFEGLTRLDRTGAVQPGLAESWTVSGDGLTYTFRLRAGVTFHDGAPFTSADVKFSLDRARAPDSTNAQKQLFEPIESVETPDPLTALVKLKRPTGLFLYNMAWGDAVIFSAASAAEAKTKPIGTGPFKFASWTRGDRIELEKSPNFRAAGSIALDKVTFRFISDPQAQVAALKSGEADAIPNMGAPELFEDLKRDSRFKAVAGNTEGEVIAAINNARKPFDDIRVRRALAHAVDRKALIDGAYAGLGQPIGSHFSPSQPGYVDLTGVYPYDPAKARALLKEAGQSNLKITLQMPPMSYAKRSAEILQAMFQDVGVTLTLAPIEFPGKWLEQVFRQTDYDMTVIAHTEPLDIDIYARDTYYFNYRSEPFRAIIAALRSETDPAKRLALLGDAQRKLAEDCVNLFLFQLPKLGVWNARVQGLWENSPIPQMVVTEAKWQ